MSGPLLGSRAQALTDAASSGGPQRETASLELLTPDSGEPAGSDDLWEIRRNTTAERLHDWDPLGTYADSRERHDRLAEERRFERFLLRRYERIDRA